MTTTATTSKVLETGLAALAFSRRMLEKSLDGIPEDKRCSQVAPGTNTPIWVLAHIADTDDFFLSRLAGEDRQMPEAWEGRFSMKSKPETDADRAPTFAEARKVAEANRERLVTWFEGMSDDKLNELLPEELRPFAVNYGTLMCTLAAHESYHAGQVSSVRRVLDLPSTFG
jgi:uncharacterized damage-inducible protein DinB